MEGLSLSVVLVASIALILLMITHHGSPKKPSRIIVEPLGWLIDRWSWARSFGPVTKVARMLTLFRASNTGTNSPLDMIIGNLEPGGQPATPPLGALALLHQQPIGNLSGQRVVEHGTDRFSIVVGDIEEIKPFLVTETKQRSGRGGVALEECQKQSTMAAANGYLCVSVAATTLHNRNGDFSMPGSHQLIGGVILEPHLRIRSRSILASTSQLPVFLSVLPTAFLAHLFAQIWSTAIFQAQSAPKITSLATPKEHQAALLKYAIIGSADLKFRSATILFWQTAFACSLISANAEDAQMPVTPQQP